MAVTAFWYQAAFKAAFNKEIDWNESAKIKVSLHSSSYTPSQANHDYYDDVDNEVTGTGYTAGGSAIAGGTITVGGTVKLDATDLTWASSTITDARYAVMRYDSGADSTSPLIAYWDFGADQSSVDGDFKLQWHTDGAAEVVVS